MKKFMAAGVVLALVMWMSESAGGQDKKKKGGGIPFGGFGGGGQLSLLTNKDVQKDLKLTDAQVQKIAALAEKDREARKGLNFKDKDSFTKLKEMAEATNKAIDETLQPTQAKRVKQLRIQQQGVSALTTNQEVAKELNLSDEQKEKIQEIQKGSFQKIFEIFKETKGDQEAAQKKRAEVTRSTLQDALKVLTKDQQAKYRELAGPAFDGTLPAGGFFGGGGFPFPKKGKE